MQFILDRSEIIEAIEAHVKRVLPVEGAEVSSVTISDRGTKATIEYARVADKPVSGSKPKTPKKPPSGAASKRETRA